MSTASTIRLIVLDLDGTLLDEQARVSERNLAAIQRAIASGLIVTVATGKSHGSAAEILPQLGHAAPAVFTQGLLIVDERGAVLQETHLPGAVLELVRRFADQEALPVVAYAGLRLVAEQDSWLRRLAHERYHEPLPDLVGDIRAEPVNKLLIGDQIDDGLLRKRLQAIVGEDAVITQAVPKMIEVLPPGTSKGAGVRRLLERLNIRTDQMLAIGDGENDIELIEMAGIGVAMGNAHPRLKAVADWFVGDNTNSGVAEAIERLLQER